MTTLEIVLTCTLCFIAGIVAHKMWVADADDCFPD